MVTGASAWAAVGLGYYIGSDLVRARAATEREALRKFYFRSVEELSFHQRADGLVSAGWTPQALRDKQGHPDYNIMLGELGYRDEPWVKAPNIVTEHNLDMLALLNQAVRLAARWLPSSLAQVTHRRNRLRHAIFTRLYDEASGSFRTGRIRSAAAGTDMLSPHVAVDNAAWLSLSADYSGLSPEQIGRLASGLAYTVQHFVKSQRYQGKEYIGAHYFTNEFQDPYVSATDQHEQVYHVEGTKSLILGLNVFCDAVPTHLRCPEFRKTADQLWVAMQDFVGDHGFPYSTVQIKHLMTRLQAATSAIWYLKARAYYADQVEVPDQYGHLRSSW